MGDKSEIQWTDATWNPVTGCSKVSPGCAHCYAETLSLRYGWSQRPWRPEFAEENVKLKPDRLDQPLHWRKPRMIFVNSMSDLFHELVTDFYVARVFAVMAAAEHHVFQVLTKRPERMRALLSRESFWVTVDGISRAAGRCSVEGLTLPNVWLGTSIENRRFVGRADALRATPAAVRFISAEPLLGPLVISKPERSGRWIWPDAYIGHQLDLSGIDWLIVGGESGPGYRRMDPAWARDLRDAALETGVAFFFKQWGGRTPKAGGRELDDRTWDEMPSVASATVNGVT